VHIERSAGTVRVTVTGKAPLIVDFGLGTIVEFALMPLERTGP
jgi:hypothetical protein